MNKLKLILSIVILYVSNQSAFAATGQVLQNLCNDDRFFCTQIQKGETWENLFGDVTTRMLIMEINRINIALRPGMIIAIPKDISNVQLNDVAPFSKTIQPVGDKVIIYDPAQNAWAAYDISGQLVRWGAGSSGRDFCLDTGKACHTTTGRHEVYAEGSENCISHTFPLPNGGAPMPYCMFFAKGQAFHGGPNEVPGFNASHGCVRIFVEDAKWLHDEFVEPASKQNNNNGTDVIILPYPQKVASNTKN